MSITVAPQTKQQPFYQGQIVCPLGRLSSAMRSPGSRLEGTHLAYEVIKPDYIAIYLMLGKRTDLAPELLLWCVHNTASHRCCVSFYDILEG